jgi:hypothetical protein
MAARRAKQAPANADRVGTKPAQEAPKQAKPATVSHVRASKTAGAPPDVSAMDDDSFRDFFRRELAKAEAG